MFVLFGGARALLMHAAHPLVAAGARQTAMYQRDPWARLMRTLQMQSKMTFGTRPEADEAADRINRLHRKVNGVDPQTGEVYDALDHDLLLWVHAALEVSSIYFFERTVRPLTAEERQRYHEENLLAAEFMLLPRDQGAGFLCGPRGLRRQDGQLGQAADVRCCGQRRRHHPERPGPADHQTGLGFIRFAAFGTFPEPLREIYGVKWSPARERLLQISLAGLKTGPPSPAHGASGLIAPAR